MLLVGNSSLEPLPPPLRGWSRTLTSSMQAASGLAASVLAVPVAPPLASDGGGQKNKSRARPASGNQFGHHGVGNNPFLHRCSNRFSRRGYRQCRPHAYQPTTIFSQRSHGRRFSGVPCSASGSLACSRGQLYPSCGCVPGSTSAAFHLSGPVSYTHLTLPTIYSV